MSGRTFGVQASWDEVLRLLDIDIPQSELNKAIGVADSMNQQIEEFLNRFVVSATNDAGDLTFDAAGTYTFNGDLVVNGTSDLNGLVTISGDTSMVGDMTLVGDITADFDGVQAVLGESAVSSLYRGFVLTTDTHGLIGGMLADDGLDSLLIQGNGGGHDITMNNGANMVIASENDIDIASDMEFQDNINLTMVGGQIYGGGNTAANPDFSFASDPDTGMYQKSTNQLGFATNGTLRFYISGNQMFSQNNGSSTAPPYSFENDNDAGMRLRGARELAIQASSNRQIRMKAEASNMTIFIDNDAGGGVLQGIAASVNDVRYDPNNGRIFYNTSSLRFKENVVPEPGRPDLPVLPHLAHYYDIRKEYKTGDSLTEGRIYGPIAEILFSVHPELVSLDEKNRPDSPNSLHMLTFLWDRVRALEIAMTRPDMIVS